MPQQQVVYLLKDLSRLSGHSTHTLKFYLKLGLIKEAGRSPETRFRYFDHATVERLSRIRALRKQQRSLSEIRSLLQDAATASGDAIAGASGPAPSAQGGARHAADAAAV